MEIHNCIHCGTETQPNWRFCRRCGTALEKLEQQPAIAHCSNCSSPVAEGWRFCSNCGTGTADATAIGGSGLSSDDVAELIATPPADTMTTAPADTEPDAAIVAEPTPAAEPEPPATTPESPARPAERPTWVDPVAPEPIEPGDIQPEPDEPRAVRPEPSAAAQPVAPPVDSTSDTAEPVIIGMEVSFEANPDLAQEPAVSDHSAVAPPSPPQFAPPALEEAAAAPPAPPVSTDPADLAAAHRAVQPPPAPPREERPPAEPSVAAPSPVAKRETIGMVERQTEDLATAAASVDDEPVIHIPERASSRRVLTEIPKPIGTARDPAATLLPQPLGETAADRETEGLAIAAEAEEAPEVARPRVAVPEPRPRPAPRSAEHLPPIDGRTFQNPGLAGQLLQLTLILTGAVSVGMMLGLFLLNNRLNDYAANGEGLNRIESAESLINTWLRPGLALMVLGAYILFVFWLQRVTRNLSFFDRGVPETALWMWAIPVVNVFVLYRHLDLGWKGSDALRGSSDWRKGRPDWWNLAFALLIVAGFGLIIYGYLQGSDTFEVAIDANSFSLIGYFLLTVSLLCASKAVENVIHRQRTRAESFA